VLVKDNIAAAGMPATAGSGALAGAESGDAFLVARLRAAGAVILGKANLSEWANIRSTGPTSGWSTLGGQTVNPHGTGRNPSGSNSGSAAAVAWLRPGAATSPGRLFCHLYGRGKGQAQMTPGWPYLVIAALEPGRTSWTAVLGAVRLGPDDDETEVTAAQVREVVGRLVKMLFMVAAMAAEMEHDLIRERTLDGLHAAKAQGRGCGRM
jgi:Amidase/DDE superfamily endonuclease